MFSRGGFSNLWRFSATGFSTTLPHTGSRRPNRAELELCWSISLSWAQTATQGQTGPSLRFLSKNEVTPPPKKGGLAIVFLGFVEFALLVYNRLTRLQQGLFGASLVSFPYAAFKTAHRATRGRVWVYRFFLRRFCSGKAASPFPTCNSPPLG